MTWKNKSQIFQKRKEKNVKNYYRYHLSFSFDKKKFSFTLNINIIWTQFSIQNWKEILSLQLLKKFPQMPLLYKDRPLAF